MAMDLAREKDFDVTVVDARSDALARAADGYRVKTVLSDLSDAGELAHVIEPFDVVVGALSSVIGLRTLRAVASAGKRYCDVSFMPEDAWEVDALACEHGAVAVVDCGVAPGMSNMICGWAASHLDPCERIEIYVGGLPVVRRWPYDYKAAFAPSDVLEEYVRPARVVEHGRIVVREALSDPELMDLPEVGTVEAFNTDGLRSLAYRLKVPFMKEKTLRWPGHIALMRAMRESGLLSLDPIDVGGVSVRPRDVLAKLLFPKWTYDEGEADLTVMRVVAEGRSREGARVRHTWDLLDRYDPVTHLRSMSRTTAFPATIVARMLARGEYREPGVHPPEDLGAMPGVLDSVLAQLAERGVRFTSRVET